jgi:hypothetical protein
MVDIVPLTIDRLLLFDLASKLPRHLIKSLKIDSPESAHGYLSEDARVQMNGEELTVRRNKLESMRKELYHFGRLE